MTASMRDKRTQTGTLQCETSYRHSNLTLTANQINTENSERITHLQRRAMDDNNNRQKTHRFTHVGNLNYHCGADDGIVKIINRRLLSRGQRARRTKNGTNGSWPHALPMA